MPTYTYKRQDGSTFEIEQRISEEPLSTCPDTGQPVKRIITGGAGLVFKGSGFYLTDYARENSSGSSEPSSSESSEKKTEKASGGSNELSATNKQATDSPAKKDDSD